MKAQWRRSQQFAQQIGLSSWMAEVWAVFWHLVKVMVPILFVVRIIELLGLVDDLAFVLEPIMAWLGLPAEMGLVWMSAMLSNIYTAMAVFYQLGGGELTVAQVSVLGTMILIAHALPMEVAIARSTGVSATFTIALRVLGALLLGWLLHITYSHGGWLQEPVNLIWKPDTQDTSWLGWAWLQVKTLAAAFMIIAALTLMLRIFRRLGVERLIHWLLSPLLRALGISVQASNIMIVGLTLGIAFGGGLLIQEARSGKMDGKDVFLVMAFLGLCHSMIEDTLLILLLGADISAVLWARLAFALVITFLLAKVLGLLSQRHSRWLYR